MSPPRPLVFIREDSASLRKVLTEMLLEKGVQAFYPVITSDGSARTTVMDDFKCALLALDRKHANDDAVDGAELLLTYQPKLPIAFLGDTMNGPILKRAVCIGPVFSKSGELEAAVAWVVEQTK